MAGHMWRSDNSRLWKDFSFVVLALTISGLILCCESYLVDSNPYRHVETLDGEGKYVLEWMVDWGNKRVIFNITAETTGYIGFGLSRRGKMTGADIIIGGVDSNTGKPYLSDRHAIGHQLPVIDSHQDWTLHAAWESGTHTFISFSRAFDTCDKEDYPITEDIISLIWSIGENDNQGEYHFHHRGSFEVFLLDPDLVPRVAQPHYRKSNPEELGDLKVWSINKLEVLPPKETFYTCSFHKAPRFPKKHHIVGFNTVLHSELESQLIHRFIIYRCHPPPGRDAAAFFERFVRNKGQECYSLTSTNKIPTENCQEPIHVFTVGSKAIFLPDHVGIPMSEVSNEYFMVQTHYENIQRIPAIRLRFSLEIFYTSNVRKHDAGAMIVGQKMPASPSIVIPPSSLGHVIYGHCGEGCTKQMLPDVGISVFAASLHTHLTGKGVRMLHVRQNEELPWITFDDNYNFNIQRTRILRKERTILPGDQIITRCSYQTTGRPFATVGGVSLRHEICLGVLWYYNRIPGYGICNSEITSDLYYAKLGIRNVTWSDEKLEMVVNSPQSLAGLTVSEVASRNIKWTINRRSQLQEDHRFLPQITHCPRLIPGLEPPPLSIPQSPIAHTLQRYNPKSGSKSEPLPSDSEYITFYSKDVLPFVRAQVCVKQTKEVMHVNEYQAPVVTGGYQSGTWWTINSKSHGY